MLTLPTLAASKRTITAPVLHRIVANVTRLIVMTKTIIVILPGTTLSDIPMTVVRQTRLRASLVMITVMDLMRAAAEHFVIQRFV
jgi:hypothetical protein